MKQLVIKPGDVIFTGNCLFKLNEIVYENSLDTDMDKSLVGEKERVKVNEFQYSRYPGFVIEAESIEEVTIEPKQVASMIPNIQVLFKQKVKIQIVPFASMEFLHPLS